MFESVNFSIELLELLDITYTPLKRTGIRESEYLPIHAVKEFPLINLSELLAFLTLRRLLRVNLTKYGRATALEKPGGGVFFDGGPGFDAAASRSDGGGDSFGRMSQGELCFTSSPLENNMQVHLPQKHATFRALFQYVGRWMGLYDSLFTNAPLQRSSDSDVWERLAGRCGSRGCERVARKR